MRRRRMSRRLDPELHAVFCSPLEKLLFSSTSLELTANT